MGRKLLSMLIAVQFLTACPGSNSGGYATTPIQFVPQPFVLSNLTISTVEPLDYSVSNFTSPTNAAGLNIAMPMGGSAMASCVAAYSPTALPVASNLIPVATYSPSNLAVLYDSTQDRTVHFGVTYTGYLNSCYGEGLLWGIGCGLATFSVGLANLLAFGSGPLWIVGDDGYGSNVLIANKWSHTLAANLAATTSTDGVIILGTFLNNVYFKATIAGVSKLYRSNGTTVQQVTQFNPVGVDDRIGNSGIVFQGKFYFTATTGVGADTTLYRLHTNGTIERVSSDSIAAEDFAIFQNKLYFSGLVGANNKLLSYDGSSLCQVSNINAGTDAVSHLRVNNNTLYFMALAPAGAEQAVMSYNGTGISRLTDTNPGGNDGITRFVAVGTSLFLGANNSVGLSKLFEITSTQALQTSNLAGNSASDSPVVMTNGSSLFFTAMNGSNVKLYTIESTQIVQMTNINAGNDIFTPITQHDIPTGELWAEYTNSSGQGALVKINRRSIDLLNQPAWYQTLMGNPAGVNTVNQIAKLGENYIYADTLSGVSKLYLMKR